MGRAVALLDASLVHLDATTHAEILLGAKEVKALQDQFGRSAANEVCKSVMPDCACHTCQGINRADFDKLARWLRPAKTLRDRLHLKENEKLQTLQGLLTLCRDSRPRLVVLRSKDESVLSDITKVLKACKIDVVGHAEDAVQLAGMAEDGTVGVVTTGLSFDVVTYQPSFEVQLPRTQKNLLRSVVDRTFLLGWVAEEEKKTMAAFEDQLGRNAEERFEDAVQLAGMADDDDSITAKNLSHVLLREWVGLGGSARPQDTHLMHRGVLACLHFFFPLMPVRELALLAGKLPSEIGDLNHRDLVRDREYVRKVANGANSRDQWAKAAGKAISVGLFKWDGVERHLNKNTRKEKRKADDAAQRATKAKRAKAEAVGGRNSRKSDSSMESLDAPLA